MFKGKGKAVKCFKVLMGTTVLMLYKGDNLGSSMKIGLWQEHFRGRNSRQEVLKLDRS